MAEIKKTYAEKSVDRLTDEEAIEQLKALHKRVGKLIGQDKIEQESRIELTTVANYVLEAEERLKLWGQMQGLSCGYRSIDQMTLGFVAGDLIILGGYTSRGKTQLALNMAYHMAMEGVPVLFVTMEMSQVAIVTRLLRLGEIDHELPIFVQTARTIEAHDLGPMIAKAKADGAQMVMVDHLHYFARGGKLLEAVGLMVHEFKKLAMEHEIPILLLSQLSRPENKRGKLGLPRLGDLKESGYIETDADVVLMVHRDLMTDDEHDEGIDPDLVFVAMRKNRERGDNSTRNTITLRHDAKNGVRLSEDVASQMFPSKR